MDTNKQTKNGTTYIFVLNHRYTNVYICFYTPFHHFDLQQKETKKDNDNNVSYFNIFEKK